MSHSQGKNKEMDSARRNLIAVTAVVGGPAAVVAAVPFAATMLPSERARALGAPVEADIGKLAPGEMQIIEWRGKPVWIIRRTKEMLDGIKQSDTKVADPTSDV